MIVTCCRTVTTKPFTFSDGLTLPVNTRFGFPIKAIQYDPANVPDAYAFDGFRFVKQASAEGNVAEASRQSTATAMDKTNLAWGYGNHACPGRFFTVRLMKLILTKLLLEFDIGWSRDAKLDRPAPLNVEGQFVPDPMQKIKLRRRVP
jgi:cytochrome P450